MKGNFVNICYLPPKKLAVIVALTFGIKPPPIISVMMDLKTKEIDLLDVHL